MSNIYVLHHEDSDGYASALTLYRKFGDKAKYIPVQYGRSLPKLTYGPNTEVYIVDFSYSRAVLEELKSKVKTLLVIDHHDTAKEELAGLDYAIFDLSKSGARLTWEYFNPGKEMPVVMELVEDRDMWIRSSDETDYFEAGMKASPRYQSLKYWNEVLENHDELQRVLDLGKILEEEVRKTVSDFVARKRYRVIPFYFNGRRYRAAIYNATTLISRLATGVYSTSGDSIELTISYFTTHEGEVVFSFRAPKDNDVDVSAIAKHYGGGGRAKTASCKVPLHQGLAMLSVFYAA